MQLFDKFSGRLTGRQIAQIRDALLAAFTKDALREMVRVELDEILDHIADGENLRIAAFNLVSWAEQHGRIEDLILSAYRANGGNPQLQKLLLDSRTWPTAKPMSLSSQGGEPPDLSVFGSASNNSQTSTGRASIDIFLSYSRKDGPTMRAVQETLREIGFSVWTDEGLEPGTANWVTAIQEAIEQANSFVVLLSPAAKASHWVNREISYAEVFQKHLLPVLIAGDIGSATPLNLINVQSLDARENLREVIVKRLLPVLKDQLVLKERGTPDLRADSPLTPRVSKCPLLEVISGESRPVYSCLTLTGHTGPVSFVTFAPSGSIVATAGADGSIRLWGAYTGELLSVMQWHTGGVNSIAFSRDGMTLASASDDKTICLWDAQTGERRFKLKGHTGFAYSVAINPDASIIASGGEDTTVRLWDARTGELQRVFTGHSRWVKPLAFSVDGLILASGGGDTTVRLWDVSTGEMKHTLQGHINYVSSVIFLDHNTLASSSSDSIIRLWNIHTGQSSFMFMAHPNHVNSIAFTHNNTALASGGRGKIVRLWDVRTGARLADLEGHSDTILSIAFNSSDTILASASADHTVRLWSVKL